MLVLKKVIHLFVLLVFIESTMVYSIDMDGIRATGRTAIIWIWDEALRHPIPAGILSGVGVHIILDLIRNKVRDREIDNNLKIQECKKLAAETENILNQIALESNSDWQQAQIKLMAAEAFQQSDPEVLKQKKREKELEFEVKQLQIDSAQLEIAKEKISFLDKLKERVSATRKLLQDELLSEEEQAEKYAELVSLRGMFNRISSSTA